MLTSFFPRRFWRRLIRLPGRGREACSLLKRLREAGKGAVLENLGRNKRGMDRQGPCKTEDERRFGAISE
jgi:hypothetical protein